MLKQTCVLLLLALFCGNSYAGNASVKLSELADSLIKGYHAKYGEEKRTLAVFPLNCDNQLEKQRVGFAASELMSHSFIASSRFTVLERSDIGKLLAEQKFQASGAVDNETAVNLGKILGAKLILLGNIQGVGTNYQINARIVNAETSEIIVSGYQELSKASFESDAQPYINLAPEVQTIGVYAIHNTQRTGKTGPAFGEGVGTYTPKSFSVPVMGGGVLYRPQKAMQINLEAGTSLRSAYFTDYASVVTSAISCRINYYSIAAAYVNSVSRRVFYSVGLGAKHTKVEMMGLGSRNTTGLFIKTGFEYKPQSRIAIGINMKYDLSKVEAMSAGGNKFFELAPLYFEPVVTLYF